MEAMERWLSSQQGDLSAPGLHLLEAALASWRYCPAGVLPEGLREDLQQALGEEEVQAAVSNLLACHILEEVPGQESSGLRLREEARTTVSAYLRRTREKVLWRTAQGMGDISFPTGAILTAVGTILYSGNGTGWGTFPHCGRGALPNLENPLSLLVALGGERGGWGQDPCLWSLCGPRLGTALPLL